MTRFKWMAKEGLRGADLGIVRPDILAKFFRYEMYLNELARGSKSTQAVRNVSDKTRLSEKTIWEAVHFFKVTNVKG